MLSKVSKTIEALESHGATLIEKKPDATVMLYEGHKINVLSTGSIFIDNNKKDVHAFKEFRKLNAFKALIN